MLGRLRCKLGLHSMKTHHNLEDGGRYRECTRCHKQNEGKASNWVTPYKDI